jgi:hypothetical protein
VLPQSWHTHMRVPRLYVFVCDKEEDRKWHGIVEGYFTDIVLHSSTSRHQRSGAACCNHKNLCHGVWSNCNVISAICVAGNAKLFTKYNKMYLQEYEGQN